MKWIKLFEEFQLGDLNFMPPEEIQDLFMEECEKQNPDINLIRVIVENGLVDVNAKYYGISPLHSAIRGDNVEIANMLISAGAKVNAKDDWGNSPLLWAVRRGYVEMQALLKKHGAL